MEGKASVGAGEVAADSQVGNRIPRGGPDAVADSQSSLPYEYIRLQGKFFPGATVKRLPK